MFDSNSDSQALTGRLLTFKFKVLTPSQAAVAIVIQVVALALNHSLHLAHQHCNL